MPIGLNDVQGIDDVLDNVRFSLFLGSVPGTSDTRHLTIKNVSVDTPGMSNSQTRASIYGWPKAWRGGKTSSNQFNASFFEDSKGRTARELAAWKKAVYNSDNGTSLLKAQYAVDAQLELEDSVGEVALALTLAKIFPLEISLPKPDGRSSEASLIEVLFSYDGVSLVDTEAANRGVQYSKPSITQGSTPGQSGSYGGSSLNSALNRFEGLESILSSFGVLGD